MNILMYKFVTRKLWFWELLVVVALILFLSSCSSSSQAAEVQVTREPPKATATTKPTSTPEPTATPLPTSTPTPVPTDTPEPTPTATQDLQAKPVFGQLFYDGTVVRTVVPPAAAPMRGRDNLYPVMGGVEGQLPVAAVAPGDKNYHGGQWAVHVVMWKAGATPYKLMSEDAVLMAYQMGDVTITRALEADFKCPIQP